MQTIPPPLAPEGVAAWAAREACRDLVMRSALYTDARNAQAYAALFAENGELQRPGGTTLHGRDAIHAAYAARPASRLTRHMVSNCVVTMDGPTQAGALSYVLMWSGSTEDADTPSGRPAQPQQMVGEYEDRFVLVPEGWRIQSRQARFVLYR